MKEKREDKLLRLWKIRQEAEGHDVSGVTTLKEAEHFFDKKELTKKELMAIAQEMGLEVKESMNKAEITAAIEEAKRAAEDQEDTEDTDTPPAEPPVDQEPPAEPPAEEQEGE